MVCMIYAAPPLKGYISYFCDLAENVTAFGGGGNKVNVKEYRRRVQISGGRKH